MVLVIGSGAAGATVARELAGKGVDVTVLEKGPYVDAKNAFKCYDEPEKELDLLKTTCIGGSTLVAAGNAIRVLEDTLRDYGVDISQDLDAIERELDVAPLPDTHIGRGTRLIMDAAESLNLPVQKMPKFIRPDKCKPCGKCSFGCPRNAKWSAREFIDEAAELGAKIIDNTEVEELLIVGGSLRGVKTSSGDFHDDVVVLSSGAVSTPRILQTVGIDAGNTFFMDTFVTVGGIMPGVNFHEEVQMGALIMMDNFLLSPHFSTALAHSTERSNILGLMVKIADETMGRVSPDGVVKYNTLRDIKLLSQGAAIAGALLSEAGVDARTIRSTHPRGAHPGGTAPIGEVVDENLETAISGLFVADASVLPEAPGAPPILTIMALARRLARYIASEY